MRKFFGFLRYYWFGLLMSFILLIGFLFFLLVILSPRYDSQKRGFIPCTEELAQNLASCKAENKYSCGIKHILKHSWCNVQVIGQGFSAWWQGKQQTPWANYIFEPENAEVQPENFFEPGRHPDMELKHLQKLNEEIEKQNQKLEQTRKEKEDEEKR